MSRADDITLRISGIPANEAKGPDTTAAGMIIGQAKGKFKRMPAGGLQIDGDKQSLVLSADGKWSIEK